MTGFRGRFAPSPTGELHLGNARTALLGWLQARAVGGEFVLRVEDLDAGRVRPGYMRNQLADLRWLGLDWDEGPDVGGAAGPYEQSRRTFLYEQAISVLEGQELIYPCFCSRREVAAAASAPHGPQDEGPVYPGTCRGLTADEARRRGQTRAASLRFRTRRGEVRFTDLLQGDQVVHPAEETGDFVIRRRDGVAAYQLAVVVDDIAMGITDVLRGADLLSSTARQILLYSALGHPAPRWTHVPLMLDPEGERLSKRHGAITLAALREMGVAPTEVVGWLAASCGLAAQSERVRPADLVERFALAAIPPAPTLGAVLPWG